MYTATGLHYFVVPEHINKLRIQLVGGGGGGFDNFALGGAGAYLDTIIDCVPFDVISLTVGRGGTNQGGVGWTTSFGDYFVAGGGSGTYGGGSSDPGEGVPGDTGSPGFIEGSGGTPASGLKFNSISYGYGTGVSGISGYVQVQYGWMLQDDDIVSKGTWYDVSDISFVSLDATNSIAYFSPSIPMIIAPGVLPGQDVNNYPVSYNGFTYYSDAPSGREASVSQVYGAFLAYPGTNFQLDISGTVNFNGVWMVSPSDL